jgi:hypothetical protein
MRVQSNAAQHHPQRPRGVLSGNRVSRRSSTVRRGGILADRTRSLARIPENFWVPCRAPGPFLLDPTPPDFKWLT